VLDVWKATHHSLDREALEPLEVVVVKPGVSGPCRVANMRQEVDGLGDLHLDGGRSYSARTSRQ
jgi:hypothetical protein